jgi:hypothetical protein
MKDPDKQRRDRQQYDYGADMRACKASNNPGCMCEVLQQHIIYYRDMWLAQRVENENFRKQLGLVAVSDEAGRELTRTVVLEKARDTLRAEIKRAQAIIDELAMWREAWLTRPHKSTPEMRERIRELATGRDDFDRAVIALLDDFEAEEAAKKVSQERPLEGKNRLENTLTRAALTRTSEDREMNLVGDKWDTKAGKIIADADLDEMRGSVLANLSDEIASALRNEAERELTPRSTTPTDARSKE